MAQTVVRDALAESFVIQGGRPLSGERRHNEDGGEERATDGHQYTSRSLAKITRPEKRLRTSRTTSSGVWPHRRL